VGESWVFHRLKDTLDHACWAGIPPGESLRKLGKEIRVSALGELGDIIGLSSNEGAGIYRILRAKATSIHEGLLLQDLNAAHEANEKLSLPVSLLGVIFLAVLMGPALLSMIITLPGN
jgi:hypothetical protein